MLSCYHGAGWIVESWTDTPDPLLASLALAPVGAA